MKFLDEAKIYVRSGDGGAGAIHFHRAKFIARGGPDGGDGGDGGDIIAECADGLNTLIDYRYRQHFKAEHGSSGMGKNRTGAKGADKILRLPAGTQIFDEAGMILLGELTKTGQHIRLLQGGRGGRGNMHFKGPQNQSPGYAQPGQKGEESAMMLRLSLIADAGLVGLPNAGKSSLLAAISAAHPKIADYPFTTLHPNLGVVRHDDFEFILADIPGLISGAHQGAGLGQKFLRHIERCHLIVHLIDTSLDDIAAAWKMIHSEISAYSSKLAKKKEIIFLSKSDLINAEDLAEKINHLSKVSQREVFSLSCVAHAGLDKAKQHIHSAIQQIRAQNAAQENKNPSWQP